MCTRAARHRWAHAARTRHPLPHSRSHRRAPGAFAEVDTLAPARPATSLRDAGRGHVPLDEPTGGEPLAAVVHLADRVARPPRDGATRHGQAAPIDAQNRVSLGKALSALGWDQRTLLVAARENGHYVVRAGDDSPLLTRVPVDAQRRLTLPPAVLGGLDVRPGDQIQAAVVVDTAELHLFAAADALQLLTGALPAGASAEAAAEPAAARPSAGGSRIRSRWRAADRGAPRPGDTC